MGRKLKKGPRTPSENLKMSLKESIVALVVVVVAVVDGLTMQGNIHRVSSKYGKRNFRPISSDSKTFHRSDYMAEDMYGSTRQQQMKTAYLTAKDAAGAFPPRVGRVVTPQFLNVPPRTGDTLNNVQYMPPRVGRQMSGNRQMADNRHYDGSPPRSGRDTITDYTFTPRAGKDAMTDNFQAPTKPRTGRDMMTHNLPPFVTDSDAASRVIHSRRRRDVSSTDDILPPRLGRAVTTENHDWPPRVGRTTDNNVGPIGPRVGRTMTKKSQPYVSVATVQRKFTPRSGRDVEEMRGTKRSHYNFPPGLVATGYDGKEANDAKILADILRALADKEAEYSDASLE